MPSDGKLSEKVRPRRTRVDWRPAYLSALVETGMHGRACAAAKVSVRVAYRERVSNPAFAHQVEESLSVAALLLEDEAVRRARDGLVRMKFKRNGEPLINPRTGEPYFEHEYSDTLMTLLLRANLPVKYRERVEQMHTGSALEPLSELAKRVAAAKSGV